MSKRILARSAVWGKTRIGRLVLILLITLVSLAAYAAESPRPVFVHAVCDGKISSAVLSSFSEGVRASQKYRLVPTVADNGRMDVVLTVYMHCTERNDVAAVATNYGVAKCASAIGCHGTIDGSSVRSALCDSNAAAECGRALFKAFDDYMSNPIAPPLKVN